MIRRTAASAALLSLVVFSSAGCAAIQGDRVETSMSDGVVVDLEPKPLPVEEPLAAPEPVVVGEVTTEAEAGAVIAGGPVSVEDVLQVRPISNLAPEWATKPQAFDFLAPELFRGALVSGSDLYESGPFLMIFVSPGCAVSVDDGPAFAEVAERDQGVTFVFVHTDGDAESFEEFVEAADLYQENVIHINDSDLTLWNRFGIETQPSTVLIDRNGRTSVAAGGLGHEGMALVVGLLDAAS